MKQYLQVSFGCIHGHLRWYLSKHGVLVLHLQPNCVVHHAVCMSVSFCINLVCIYVTVIALDAGLTLP